MQEVDICRAAHSSLPWLPALLLHIQDSTIDDNANLHLYGSVHMQLTVNKTSRYLHRVTALLEQICHGDDIILCHLCPA